MNSLVMEEKLAEKRRLPDKLYYRIGEVSAITGLAPYVLRFWESEFKKIRPKRTDSGQRLYRKKDVELIMEIKNLLYQKKYTIQGARQYLKVTDRKKKTLSQLTLLREIQIELQNISNLLK
jgi:DNA-binding transcriptional MerR regulator